MPKPVLQAMVLADQVYVDRASGKHIIAGTFTTVFYRQIQVTPVPGEPGRHILTETPTAAGSPYLYLALSEVHGTVSLDLKYVDLSDASVLFAAKIEVTSADPVVATEYILPMPRLPKLDEAGTYSLDLLHDNEILASWRISVKQQQMKQNKPTEGEQ